MAASTERTRPPKYLGARVLRVEDPRFLRGGGQYIDDISFPEMGHAAFYRSPHGHARIKSIDIDRARALEGVHAVFTGEELKDLVGPLVSGEDHPDIKVLEQRVLPLDKVRHVGEAVAVVVAVSRYVAEDAVGLIDVDWEPLPVVMDAEESMKADAPRLDETMDDNNTLHLDYEGGDVERALGESDRVFTKRFYFGRQSASPLETRGLIASYDPSMKFLTIWSSNQMPHLTRSLIAGPLGLPEGSIRVIAPDVGGAFGLKCHVFVEDLVIPVAARLLGRPVKWIEDRYENLAASGHAREVTYEVDFGVDDDGTFRAISGRLLGNAGAYQNFPYTAFIDVGMGGNLLPGPYDFKNVRYVSDAPLTNKLQTSAYRATGMVVGNSIREIMIDEIARELDVDSVELRLKNTIPPEPYVNALDMAYDGGSYEEAVRTAAEAIGYDGFRREQAADRTNGRYRGIGFSTCVEPAGWGTESARACKWGGGHGGGGGGFFDSASVTVEPDGSVTVTTGLHSHGQSHETTFAQLAADVVGVRLEDVRYRQGDTDSAVYGAGTYASRSAVIGGGTIIRAGRDVREKLVRLAAHQLEADPGDIEIYDGRASVKGSQERSVEVSELAALAYFGHTSRPADLEEPALTSTRSYDPPQNYNNSCYAAIVEVDTGTGVITVERFVAVEDCGVMLNPTVVEGQVAGGVAQGIGMALLEEVVYGEEGQLLSASLMEFLYPSMTDLPDIETLHLETPSPVTEGGIRGLGEAGLVTTPGAIVNAAADALSPFGVTLDRLPLNPDYVLGAIRATR